MSRADVIRQAFLDYHAGKITWVQLVRCVAQFRVTAIRHDGRRSG